MYNHQLHCRQTVRYTAASRDDARQKFLLIGAYLIASAVIALWLSYLPQLTGSIGDSFNIVPQHPTENSVNRLHKGDRLVGGANASFDARWSGIATVRKPASLPKRMKLTPPLPRYSRGTISRPFRI
jgi:hypothetical protein